MLRQAHLPDRAVLAVSGTDRVSFLQGLLSNDIGKVAPGKAIWSALLTPQGRLIADLFVLDDPARERLLLDVAGDWAEDLRVRLSRFRLRAKVAVEATELGVSVAWGGDGSAPEMPEGVVGAPDPRLGAAGWRVLAAAPLPGVDEGAEAYDAHRLALGLPDSGRDLDPGRTLLLEAGFDELHGVSWDKGCYVGQELTARTKYRGLLKRRLVPVALVRGAMPERDAILRAGEKEAGSMRSSRGGVGLALVGIDHLDAVLEHDGGAMAVLRPDWLATVVADAGDGAA